MFDSRKPTSPPLCLDDRLSLASGLDGRFTSQTLAGSNWLPVAASLPGLLTTDGLAPRAHDGFPDGMVLNEDGTLNSPDNPVARGGTITLFATGMGETDLSVLSGAVAESSGIVPKIGVYSTWTSQPFTGPLVPPDPASTVTGAVAAMLQIRVKVPPGSPGSRRSASCSGPSSRSIRRSQIW